MVLTRSEIVVSSSTIPEMNPPMYGALTIRSRFFFEKMKKIP